ncbi:PDZ domain-containing protein [Candidatus Colwellia aromaticivorans]|uniref:M61 family metallopeptidase n=1 Tax=Candidatus Colwellia aromaticivorans TaxID=2267621 RepID=UPI000DF367F8
MLYFVHCTIAQANVSVNIRIDQPQHHYAQITIKFDKFNRQKTNFYLPTWRTGRYEIINLANGIREFSAMDESGNTLKWKKIDKDTWQVQDTLDKKVEISYQVYANQLGQRTRHIDDSHAFIDASTVVMYNDSTRYQKHHISLNVPASWRSVSGLELGTEPHQFIAKNYDVLADSPIETGINEHYKFSVDSLNYELVIWGKGNYDSAKMVADLTMLVQQSKHIWQGYPFERYVFMVHATSGARGATEHLNSTIIQRSRFQFSSRKDYLGFISTAAHEFIHTWNVKQYRPKGLVPYDYQQENYSTLLWVSEGSTSYLQNQLLLRGDLMSSEEFLESLAKWITGYIHKPGRQSQTVAEASFDKWLEEGGDYDKNHSVNIYSEGFLVSWLLDFSIIEKTNLEKSYRDVHNILYQNHKIPKSFDEADLVAILKQMTGDDYQYWWQENVHGYAKVDFDQLLAKAGLTMFYGDKENSKQQAWTGLKTKLSPNGLQVTTVEKNSPAWQAGFMVDDIIVAVNGLRMVDKNLSKRLTNFQPKDQLRLTYFRRDELDTRRIVLGTIPEAKLKVIPLEQVSKNQKAFFKQWTGIDFPSPNQ